jgi:hypothetical protein
VSRERGRLPPAHSPPTPLLLLLLPSLAVAETRSRQLELDKVAADFRALHAERTHLLGQWQEGLKTIQTRDNDIAQAAGAC